ncbi:hypothetical protein [Limnoglobus roseus]|nr:hypothetical protein [Limnoglobus roseus]
MRQLVAEMESSKELSSSLDRQSHNIQDVITFNQLVLDDVIAGRIELTEAAKQKWEVNGVNDFFQTYLTRVSSAPGYEAKTAHDLLVQARDLCAKSDLPAVSSRLRQQYEAGYGPLPE